MIDLNTLKKALKDRIRMRVAAWAARQQMGIPQHTLVEEVCLVVDELMPDSLEPVLIELPTTALERSTIARIVGVPEDQVHKFDLVEKKSKADIIADEVYSYYANMPDADLRTDDPTYGVILTLVKQGMEKAG